MGTLLIALGIITILLYITNSYAPINPIAKIVFNVIGVVLAFALVILFMLNYFHVINIFH